MASQKITLVTPVWNGMPYLAECIQSVLSQEFGNWEMLISDDGSSDGSREYLRTLEDKRIKVFEQKENLGIFGNLNFLFQKSETEITQILCQDDYFTDPGSLFSIVNYWDFAPSTLGFVRFNHMQESSEIQTIDLQQRLIPPIISAGKSDIWFFLFGNIPGNLSNVSLRTKIVSELGGFNQALPFAGDFEFWIRAANCYAMGVQNLAVVFVRRHANVASNFLSQNGELYTQHILIYESLLDRLVSEYHDQSLVDYFSFEMCSFHYRTGIRSALFRGNFQYLNTFFKTKSKILWPKWRLVTNCFPLAIFEKRRLRITVKKAKRLLESREIDEPGASNYSD